MSSAVISDHHLPGVAAHLADDPGPGLLPADVDTADLAPALPDDEHFLHLPGCVFTIFLGTVQFIYGLTFHSESTHTEHHCISHDVANGEKTK